MTLSLEAACDPVCAALQAPLHGEALTPQQDARADANTSTHPQSTGLMHSSRTFR